MKKGVLKVKEFLNKLKIDCKTGVRTGQYFAVITSRHYSKEWYVRLLEVT